MNKFILPFIIIIALITMSFSNHTKKLLLGNIKNESIKNDKNGMVSGNRTIIIIANGAQLIVDTSKSILTSESVKENRKMNNIINKYSYLY